MDEPPRNMEGLWRSQVGIRQQFLLGTLPRSFLAAAVRVDQAIGP